MAAPIYPDVNGNRYDHSSVEITILGVKFSGIKSINYKAAQDPTMIYGNSSRPVGRTRGQQKPEGSIEMYRLEFDQFCALLRQRGRGLQTTSFGVVCSYSENLIDVSTDELIGCRIKNVDTTSQEGVDSPTVKLDLSVMALKLNGVEMTDK